jgi:hypothetical protein
MVKGMKALLLTGLIAAVSGSPASAQVQFPTLARNYSTWMARAMDQCTPSGLTVLSPGLPGSGCVGANTVTDNQMTMTWARLVVSGKTGKVKVFGRGLIPGSRVKVQLALRVTKGGVLTKHPPSTNQKVTFQDVVILCAQTPFGFVVNSSGVLAGSADLATCLAPHTGLATGNIEIVEAGLVNHDNSDRLFARSGILR